jgi:hypothetical protein
LRIRRDGLRLEATRSIYFLFGEGGQAVERRPVTLDGLTPDEVLALPDDELDALVLCGEPLVFRVGTAEILGRFWVAGGSLVLELGHIDGGGEGVLPTLAALAERYARRRGLSVLDRRVHALNCARPNPRLRRVLERRGFVVADVPGSGPCYHQVQTVPPRPAEHGAARDRGSTA